ncbi:DUF5801 repeats-in-toxin domain-containing protein, partial [Halomonas koreensis]
MSEHDEDILQVTSPGTVTVDESPDVTDDEITVEDNWAAQLAALFPDGDEYDFAKPANLARKTGFITTDPGLTNIGWASDEEGSPVSDQAALDGDGNPIKALDPDSGNYETVTLNTDPDNDNILIGTTESGNIAFIAVIVEGEEGPDGASHDVYILDYLPKEHGDDTDHDDSVSLDGLFVTATVSQTVEFDFEGAPSGHNDFMAFGDPDGVAIVVTGRFLGEEVNSSQSGNEPTSLAADSNNINAEEGLVVTYVNDMEDSYIVPDLSGPEASDPANIQFASLQTATEASVTIVKVGPGSTTATVHLTALFTEKELGDGSTDGTEGFIPGIADDIEVPISAVSIISAAGVEAELDMDSSKSQYYTLESDGSVVVYGVNENDTITFVTEGDHNRVKVENAGEGNARFNLGGVAIADVNTQTDADAVTLAFDDDGPGDPTVTLSETDPVGLTFDGGLSGGNFTGTESADDTSKSTPTVAVVDFSAAFTIGNQDDFGADGAGQTDIDYALQLAVAEGTASGLTSGGESINLYINGDGTLVTGSTAGDEGSVAAGNTIFTLALNGTTGVLTQTQSGVIDHGTTDTYDGAYISDEKLLADGLVELVASAETTDSEGDTSGVNSETLDLGGNVRFGDDGPGDPTVTLSGTDPVGLTFDGGLMDGNFTGTE